MAIRIPTLSSQAAKKWDDFLAFSNTRNQSKWIFRGHASTSFELKPKIGRPRVGSAAYERRHEIAIFAKFKRQVAQFGYAERDEWALLALAQHHGLPTRLLDWTTNILVATYFAVLSHPNEDAVILAKSTRSREYIRDFDQSPFDIEEVRYFVPPSVAPRIVSQKGLFSVHPDPTLPWAEDQGDEDRFVVPAAMKHQFRRRLFAFGVDPLLIETGLDGLCRTLEWQYNSQIGVWLDV